MAILDKIEYFTEKESKSLNLDSNQWATNKSLELGFLEKSTVNFEAQNTRKLFHDEKRINPKQFVEKEEMPYHNSGNNMDSSVYYLCGGCKTKLASCSEFNRVVDAYRFRGIGKPWTAETILHVDGPLGLFENLVNVDVDMHEDTSNATRLTHRNIYCEKCSNELGFQTLTLQPDTDALDTKWEHYIFMNKLLLQRQ